ncbi:hypothetical protein H6G97_34605 [Nostoc flagelliforme FACHB-838]|uniref:VWFA domain-containing protein n=1 Tax=Nostoc flagelliforme FACHB-838 TaxID=2692904 RepID=A0ABR8DYG2_9NOSO|nr:hypothetical protein [Nostoc flagelliforme]MBD2534370.1 hypothetical protein [Nostoc flagelliforme FACHB-838]
MAPVSDIVLLQDLSGSFGDDLPRLREIIGPLVDNLRNPILERIFGADPFFGVSSFVDKPVSPFGSSGDYVYRQDLALTRDSNSVVSTVNSSTFSIRNGGDGPEAQLEALLQLTFDPNYRSGSTRIALIVTDAPFHLPPDGVTQAGSTITRPNNGDNVVDADEDYPAIAQLRDRLIASNIIPVFIVQEDVVGLKNTYQGLVDDLGRGLVVGFERGSETIADAIKVGVAGARGIITALGNNPATPDDIFDLTGTDDDQVVFTGDGQDQVTGGDGNDYIDVGSGDDNVNGAFGNDIIDVGNGNNIALGNEGNDYIFTLSGSSGGNVFSGGAGNDTLIGGSSADNLSGEAGNDALKGGRGNDRLEGGTGDDILQGDDGNDNLTGGTGNDILQGGAGNDNLNGGGGNDILTGSTGSDIFEFSTGRAFTIATFGVDQISDFSAAEIDKISLSKRSFTALDNTSNGGLIASNFAVVTSDSLAQGSSAEIVYNSSNGNLFYNQNNGVADFGTGGLFATIAGSPLLTASDFLVFAV